MLLALGGKLVAELYHVVLASLLELPVLLDQLLLTVAPLFLHEVDHVLKLLGPVRAQITVALLLLAEVFKLPFKAVDLGVQAGNLSFEVRLVIAILPLQRAQFKLERFIFIVQLVVLRL